MINLHVFIGLSAFNKNNFSYAYTVYDEFSTDSIFLMGDFVKNSTEHKAILIALKSILETFISIKEQEEYHIIFYSDNNLISFEYNNEFKKENHFSKKTEDIELWKQIINICSTHNIDLEIRGDDSPLKKLNIKTKGKLSNV